MNNEDCRLIQFLKNSHQSGQLVFMESNKEIPFEIKRTYYLYDVPSHCKRGLHAHKNLKQILIALGGSFEVTVDNGYNRKNYVLNDPQQGLYIGAKLWRELKNFSSGAICLVLAAELYDAGDYIRDYNEFLDFIRKSS